MRTALIHHPDRNPGKEGECIPRFQAIQAAHEILGDPTQKAKYDADRRKAGLYPRPPQAKTYGNPYQATSPFPPPPRRTQPPGQPTWAPNTFGRTPTNPAGSHQNASGPNGADRFTNFAKAAPTSRKDPAQDRANVFTAWANMNNAQKRQAAYERGQMPTSANPSPQRPRPPPRNDTKMPSEEEIRAGFNYTQRKPPPGFETSGREEARQASWNEFNRASAAKPGLSRSNTARTPKKSGFDPTALRDERSAADTSNYTSTRHRSHDFVNGMPPPPPPPPPPPMNSKQTSPQAQKFGDPLRQFRSRLSDDDGQDVPFSEGTRTRTPYSTYIGEKTDFSSERLRRSASTRDAAKAARSNESRPRSTSPLGRRKTTAGHAGPKTFVPYESSDDSNFSSDVEASPMGTRTAGVPFGTHFGQAKSSPAPPSRKMPGAFVSPSDPSSPSNPYMNTSSSTGTDGAANNNTAEAQDMGGEEPQRPSMYAAPNPFAHDILNHSPFSPDQWAARMFGSSSTQNSSVCPPSDVPGELRRPVIPKWAYPSSVTPPKGHDPSCKDANKQTKVKFKLPKPHAAALPGNATGAKECVSSGEERAQQKDSKPFQSGHTGFARKSFTSPDTPFETAASKLALAEIQGFMSALRPLDTQWKASNEHRVANNARLLFQSSLVNFQHGRSTGSTEVDKILEYLLDSYPSLRLHSANQKQNGNTDYRHHSFTFPIDHNTFTPNANAKSRSVENINTKFSPGGWNGTFQGAHDYFAPTNAARKASSPSLRGRKNVQMRSATTPVNGTQSETEMPPPPPPQQQNTSMPPPPPAPGKFVAEEWTQHFQEGSWAYPPAPPGKPPSPARGTSKSKTPSRKSSRSTAKPSTPHNPYPAQVVDEEEDETISGEPSAAEKVTAEPVDEDAMDIDSNTPPQLQSSTPTQANTKEPRLYSVPPSAWRQNANGTGHRKSSSMPSEKPDPDLKTNLDDLVHVAPFASEANGLGNFGDLQSSLPFQSQAATHMSPPAPLQMPAVPKAPELPTRLSKSSWHAYGLTFGAYLVQFFAFNTTILDHFNARHAHDRARLANGLGWLEATGDTSGMQDKPVGFVTYLQGVQQDEKVRETWTLGCERHAEALKAFEKVRDRVRRNVIAGTLPDV